MEAFDSVDKLAGSDRSQPGGLVYTPSTDSSSSSSFKQPKTSLFGLDKLAEKKRAESVSSDGQDLKKLQR